MLSPKDRERLEQIRKNALYVDNDAMIAVDDLEFLLLSCASMDAELRVVYERTVEKLSEEVLPRNPLSIKMEEKVRIVAKLTEHGYSCFFCGAIHREEDIALNHAVTHVQRGDSGI